MPYILDVKDRKILAELDRDARQSNSQIAKNVRLSKEVVAYRINRLMQEGVIIRFHTIVNYFRLGISKFKLYLRLTNADKQKCEEIATYFYKHHKTEWVGLCTGRWDLIVGFLVPNVNEFDDEILAVLNRFSSYIQEKAMTTTVYLAHSTRSFLQEKERSTVVYHTSKDIQITIDELDTEVLRYITNNARMPITDLAKRMHTTPRTIQYRLRELERKKIILGYKAHLDARVVGRIFCKVIIYLSNVTEVKLKEFIAYASSLSGAIWPQRVMGAWDFELDIEAESYDQFQDMLLNLKERFPDIIKNHEFCIQSKEFKLDFFPGCYPAVK